MDLLWEKWNGDLLGKIVIDNDCSSPYKCNLRKLDEIEDILSYGWCLVLNMALCA